ncbi:hypothetical protein NC651_005466 [Populus alba x Populus x berolinensis]|nr:hypothetical protein NC651_005466 [Populus alba x Populus x berolinensis]
MSMHFIFFRLREKKDFSLWEKPEGAGLDLVELRTSVNALEFVIMDWGLMFNINSGCGGWREKWTSEERVFLCSYSSPSSSPLEVVCGHMGPPPWLREKKDFSLWEKPEGAGLDLVGAACLLSKVVPFYLEERIFWNGLRLSNASILESL